MAYIHNAAFGGNADAVGTRRQREDQQADVQARAWATPAVCSPRRPRAASRCRRRFTVHPPARRAIRPPAISAAWSGRARSTSSSSARERTGPDAQNPLFVQVEAARAPRTTSEPGLRADQRRDRDLRLDRQCHSQRLLHNSEIKTGFNYTAYVAGLEGTRAASRSARSRSTATWSTATSRRPSAPRTNTTTGRRIRRERLDHGNRHGSGDRHRRHDRTGQHRRGRLRQSSQRSAPGHD